MILIKTFLINELQGTFLCRKRIIMAKEKSCPRVDIGGQAVLDGVMMKAPDAVAVDQLPRERGLLLARLEHGWWLFVLQGREVPPHHALPLQRCAYGCGWSIFLYQGR